MKKIGLIIALLVATAIIITSCGKANSKTTIKDNKLPLRLIGERLTFETNAYPFRKGDGDKLAAEVTKALQEMRADGTLKKMSEQWFELNTVDKPQK